MGAPYTFVLECFAEPFERFCLNKFTLSRRGASQNQKLRGNKEQAAEATRSQQKPSAGRSSQEQQKAARDSLGQ